MTKTMQLSVETPIDFADGKVVRAYEGANSGGEKAYQFLDIAGHPCIEIVAKRVLITVK